MTAVIDEHDVTVYLGDARDRLDDLPKASVNCIVTSPLYFGLRDYGVDDQLGLERTPAEYVAALVGVFSAAGRTLRDDGVLWLNLGDSYAAKTRGSDSGWDKSRLTNPGKVQKAQAAHRAGDRHRAQAAGISEKNLLMMPARVALALQDAGWTLRKDVIWHKPNAMPESVIDRPSSTHEHLLMLTKGPRYWFDLDAIRVPRSEATEQRYQYAFQSNGNAASSTQHLADGGMMAKANPLGRNPGDVWTIPTSPFPGAHFACMPPAIARRCILSGCPADGTVLDPFAGSGTTLMVARQLGRRGVGIELNPDYIDLIRGRIGSEPLDFGGAA